MTNPVPPIEDADRSQVYSTGMTTVTTIDLDYPLFGDARDLKIYIDDVVLASGWTLSTISGTALTLADQPIEDGRITFSPVIGNNKTIEVRYVRQPRREVQPTAGGIARREFNLVTSDIIATQRELRRDIDSVVEGNDGADGADGTNGTNGTNGWSPVFAAETDGLRSVLKVVDWTGGTSSKPATGLYVGATGLVALIANGVNIRGAAGAGTGDMVAATYDTNGDGKVNAAAAADSVPWTGVSGKPTFSTVATSGSYADLSSKPTISTVGASGVYADLTSKPSLGTAAAKDTASAAQITGNTADKILETDEVWAAAATVTLTDASTITLNFSNFINAKVTLGGNRTLAISNGKVGQTGVIEIYQDGTGSRTLAFTSGSFLFAGGTAPVLSTTASKRDLLFYQVMNDGKVFVSLTKAVATT